MSVGVSAGARAVDPDCRADRDVLDRRRRPSRAGRSSAARRRPHGRRAALPPARAGRTRAAARCSTPPTASSAPARCRPPASPPHEPGSLLPADVVDRAAHHLRERAQADRMCQRELVHRQVGGEELAPGTSSARRCCARSGSSPRSSACERRGLLVPPRQSVPRGPPRCRGERTASVSRPATAAARAAPARSSALRSRGRARVRRAIRRAAAASVFSTTPRTAVARRVSTLPSRATSR